MDRIHILPDDLINRIAAGEVVERPASVVKELVENSLDAIATRIEVELIAGGRSFIRVSDDGTGMSDDDALLALERHATSKLGTGDDLVRIMTLGFRGEALPSIAAISRFTLSTSSDPAEGGTRISVEGGRILGVEALARARGTSIEIKDLFFNTPARRKFLHAPETELRHAQDVVFAAALARPDVGFRLDHGGRTLFDAPPAPDLVIRLNDLLKNRRQGQILNVEVSRGDLTITGLLVEGGGKGRPQMTLIVNGRPVRDRVIVGAVLRVLREAGSGFGGSRVILDIRLPPEDVDVNVHPAKAEVRFARAGAVFSAVEAALRSAIDASRSHPETPRLEPIQPFGQQIREARSSVYGSDHRSSPAAFTHPLFGESEIGIRDAEPAPISSRLGGPKPGAADTPFGRIIGQYRNTFIMLEGPEGLIIIDQHVAHERVLYEKFLRRLRGEKAPSQSLAFPRVINVGEALASAVARVEKLLLKVGIEAECFGSDTVRITALPPEIEPEEATRILTEMLERATALDQVPERVAEQLEDELASAMSCKAAVKANDPLSIEEQRALLNDLAAADNSYRCPHGRPIVLELSHIEMERRLGRR